DRTDVACQGQIVENKPQRRLAFRLQYPRDSASLSLFVHLPKHDMVRLAELLRRNLYHHLARSRGLGGQFDCPQFMRAVRWNGDTEAASRNVRPFLRLMCTLESFSQRFGDLQLNSAACWQIGLGNQEERTRPVPSSGDSERQPPWSRLARSYNVEVTPGDIVVGVDVVHEVVEARKARCIRSRSVCVSH